jgi:nucleoside-diphosphate-sugar epimerase
VKSLNILVTGGAGYVGSMLVPTLVENGHQVKCLDRFFFGDEYLTSRQFGGSLELIRDDIRWFDPKILKNVDLVMDLAALSNDPVGELNPEKTFEINYKGRARVSQLSKVMGVQQYFLASSASIYGQQENIVNEDSPVNPLTAYSKANRMAELAALSLNDDSFAVTVMRFSSIYGLSPRMRFDLAVNSIVLDLFNSGKITVYGKNNKRPFLHIKDAVLAYETAIAANKKNIAGQIFNVGSDDQNYSIYDLAKETGDAISNNYILEAQDTQDNRSYVASFAKIKNIMGFVPKYRVKDGAKEIYDVLVSGQLKYSIKHITLKWYNHILSDKKLSEELSINGKLL